MNYFVGTQMVYVDVESIIHRVFDSYNSFTKKINQQTYACGVRLLLEAFISDSSIAKDNTISPFTYLNPFNILGMYLKYSYLGDEGR